MRKSNLASTMSSASEHLTDRGSAAVRQGNPLGIALQDAAERSSATFRQGYFDAALIKARNCIRLVAPLDTAVFSSPSVSITV